MSHFSTDGLDAFFEGKESTIARDLKLNLKKVMEGDGQLPSDEACMALLATATSVGHAGLAQFAYDQLAALGVPHDQILEARESAAIMGMLNTYYKFRTMVGKDDDYRTAGLRMTALARPAMGKEKFEMLALAVSIINGCETCIKAHEKVLRDSGLSADKIHDLARLAAIVKGISAL